MMNRSGIAQLASQGRGGDSMLVHMRPDEVAGMQRMAQQAGTSMTVNPMTGLPEAFQLKDLFNINTYTKPIRSAAEKIGLGGLSDALSSGFKTLGQNAQYVLPFIPGGAFAGLGSLGNFAASPVGRGLLAGGIGSLAGGRFNLKRGLMSGLTAYGLSSGYQGLQAAGEAPTPGVFGGDVEAQPGGFYGGTPDNRTAAEVINQAVNEQTTGRAFDPFEGMKPTSPSAVPVTAQSKPAGFIGELEAAGRGIKNLAMGDKGTSDAAMKAFKEKFGKGAMGATYMGTMGMMALNEQEKLLEEAKAQQQISEAEYAQYRSRIENAKRRAAAAVKENPYQFAVGGEINEDYSLQTPQLGGAAPDQKNVFGLQEGGDINLPEMAGRPMPAPERRPRFGLDPRSVNVQGDDISARFEAEYPIGKTGAITAGMGAASIRTPEGRKVMPTAMDIGARGRVGPGILSGRVTKPMMGPTQYQAGYTIPFAKGGMPPRYVEGPGDGMSDSIRARIGGVQEARIADGEFIIPADVVSHLGNGSSKAGAKQLYAMMDRVRKARVGHTKQGKEINPTKLMPA